MFGNSDISESVWPVATMEDVFSITSSRRILKSEWKESGNIPFIRVRDMVQLANKEPLTNEFYVTEDFYNSRPEEEKVKPGDIIVSATSTIGKTYIIKPGERFYFKDADVLLFRKKISINDVFFAYGLTMPTMWNQIEDGLGTTTVAHFLISKACKLRQPLPPIELQEQFAAFVQQSDKSKYLIANALISSSNQKQYIGENMSRDRSFAAVKKAIGGGSSFSGKRNVLVSMGERTFLYKDVFVSATYNIAYMQMDIDVVWEDDSSQPDYRTLGLHGRYNSHFQEFQYDDGYLRWNDGTASISILF